ncbi:unnamed protein product [Schistocephalus solidus]|uniref:DUF7083 domain-containing protein n=1 Tax=Schistocephalus solidus TaxID=70667 RepID=A0A183TCK7_SCHSO|nr:unnamed protein product [Schistocephalus solidus]
MADEYADFKRMVQQHLMLMKALSVEPTNSFMGQLIAAIILQSVDYIAGCITEFLNNLQVNIAFASWHKRYGDFFCANLVHLDGAGNVSLLIHSLDPTEHECYTNCIFPKNPRKVTCMATEKRLSKVFGEQSSRLNTQFKCPQMPNPESKDFIT